MFQIRVLTSNAITFPNLNIEPIGPEFSVNKVGNLEIFRYRPIRQSKRFILRLLQSIIDIRRYEIDPLKAIFHPEFLLSLSELKPPPQFYYKMITLAKSSEIIHTFGFSYFTNYLAYLTSKLLDIPLFVTPFFHTDTYRFGKMNQRILRHAKRIFALTKFEKRYISKFYSIPSRKIVVTGIGVDIKCYMKGNAHQFRETYGIPLNDKIVLYMANQTTTKGLHIVLDAMRNIWRFREDVTFVVAGQCFPETNRIWRKLNSSERKKTVRFNQHWGKDPIKHDALKAACCLVAPSTKESFGIIYLEAWAHRKPFIAAHIPQIASFAMNGDNAILLKMNSSRELSKLILKLLTDPKLCSQLGERGFQNVSEHYTWDLVIDKYIKTIDNFVAK